MKKLNLSLLILLCSFSAYSQTLKAYVSSKGEFTTDSVNANSFILLSKLGDSVFLCRQYDMQHHLMTKGMYKDQSMTIPNGKFSYYEKRNRAPQDTSYYLSSSGFFQNGVKVGQWNEYSKDGLLSNQYSYENGTVNCQYTHYYNDVLGKRSIGTMRNGKFEGKCLTYDADSVLVEETEYVNNEVQGKVIHLQDALQPLELHDYLEDVMKNYSKQIAEAKNAIDVKLTINKSGQVTNVRIIQGINPEVDKAFIAALLKGPKFKPATYDGELIDRNTAMAFILYHNINLNMSNHDSRFHKIPNYQSTPH